MSNDKVKQDKKVVVGKKQTAKALKSGDVETVIIAKDADPNIIQEIKDLAKERNVPIKYAESMKKLGKACGIEVGAATVAVLN